MSDLGGLLRARTVCVFAGKFGPVVSHQTRAEVRPSTEDHSSPGIPQLSSDPGRTEDSYSMMVYKLGAGSGIINPCLWKDRCLFVPSCIFNLTQWLLLKLLWQLPQYMALQRGWRSQQSVTAISINGSSVCSLKNNVSVSQVYKQDSTFSCTSSSLNVHLNSAYQCW